MEKKTLIIDFDTPIVRAAAVCQNNLTVVNKQTGKRKAFPSRTQFFKACPKASEEDFLFIDEASLIEPDGDFKIEWRAYKGIKDIINRLSSLSWVGDFKLVYGGEGNFRFDIAKTIPYKGNRGDKPLLCDHLKEWIEKKWPEHVIRSYGIEADDILGHYGWTSYQLAKQAGDWRAAPYVLVHIDKDINGVPGLHMNTDDKEHKVYWVSNEDSYRFFFTQLLYGDRTVDNIPGLKEMPESISDKFGVRKGKSIGKKTAEAIIGGADTIEEAFQRVVFCYKEVAGEDWKEYLQEQADLLWMQRAPFPEKGSRFEVEEMLKRIGEDS